MSVIRCNNNLWLHCVSIGSEYLWLVFGENPWIQMHAKYAVGARTGVVDGGLRGGMAGAGAKWSGMERRCMDGCRRMEKGVGGVGGGGGAGGGGRGRERGGQGGGREEDGNEVDGWVDGWVDEWVDGLVDAWMNGWWLNGWVGE